MQEIKVGKEWLSLNPAAAARGTFRPDDSEDEQCTKCGRGVAEAGAAVADDVVRCACGHEYPIVETGRVTEAAMLRRARADARALARHSGATSATLADVIGAWDVAAEELRLGPDGWPDYYHAFCDALAHSTLTEAA